jgi:hypothetical protein
MRISASCGIHPGIWRSANEAHSGIEPRFVVAVFEHPASMSVAYLSAQRATNRATQEVLLVHLCFEFLADCHPSDHVRISCTAGAYDLFADDLHPE